MIDGEVFGSGNLAEPERVELDGRAQIEQDLKNIVGDDDRELIGKLADYVEISVAEALLLRQPPVSALRLPRGLIADIQTIEGVVPQKPKPDGSG